MSELNGRLDALYAETMGAYVEALGALDEGDVDGYRVALRRAFRLSEAFHAEADSAVLAWRASVVQP